MVAREWAAHCQISSQRPHCAHPSKPRLQALQPGPFPLGASLVVQAGSSQPVASPALEHCRRVALPRTSGLCPLKAPLPELRGLEGRGRARGSKCRGRGSWDLRTVVSAKRGLGQVGLKPQQEDSKLELGNFTTGWLVGPGRQGSSSL